MIVVPFRSGLEASSRRSVGVILVLLIALLAVTGGVSGSPVPTWDGEIGRIDFEDRETATADWSHVFEQAPGLPPLSILFDAVVDEREAHSGRSSLRFDLQGGSISYRMRRDAAIPVEAGGRYRFSAEIRQTGLQRAVARVEARVVDLDRLDALSDRFDDPIAESTVSIHRSSIASSGTDWDTVENVFHVDRTSGSTSGRLALFLSLQVVQPGFDGQDDRNVLGARPIQIDDIAASVWFDDVRVEHLPNCVLEIAGVGQFVPHREPVPFDIVLDVPGVPATGSGLVVHDIDGRPVRRMTLSEDDFASNRIEIVGLAPGWYVAHLGVDSSDGFSVGATETFVVLPSVEDQRSSDVPRFGFQIPTWSSSGIDELDAMLDATRPSLVDLSLWPPANDLEPSLTAAPVIRSFAIGQRRHGREVTVSIDRIHDGIAKLVHVDSSEVHTALSRDDSDVVWQSLGDILARLGAGISRWRFPFGGDEHLPERLDDLLDQHVADPHLSESVSTDRLPTTPRPPQYLITSADFSSDAEEALGGGIAGATILVSPPPEGWSRRGQLDEAARRILRAWRHGADRVLISASLDRPVAPMDLAWRVIGSNLGGRRFEGSLRSSPTSHCWVANDERGPVVVAWSDLLGGDERIEIPVGSGTFSVQSVDGRREEISSNDGVLSLRVDGTPRFVAGIDPVPVGIASSIEIVPGRLALSRRDHEVRVRFRNPTARRLTGRVVLDPPLGWRFEPSELDLDVDPHGTADLPLRVHWSGPQAAGRIDLGGRIDIESRSPMRIPVRVPVLLESDALQVDADWDVVRKGESSFLRVRTTIRNIGERTMDLNIAVSAPGILREQRTISGLEAGEDITRTLRLLGGLEEVAGRTVRIEVRERGGPESIVYGMPIPGIAEAMTAVAPFDR